MTRILALMLIALSFTAASAAAAADSLSVEWADHARDPKALVGDPVFIRTLYCRDPQGSSCSLTVVSIGHSLSACPLFVNAYTYTTEAGNLSVRRTGDNLDIEVDDIVATSKLRVVLITSAAGAKIVRQASAVRVSKPVGDDPVSATELVAFVKNSKDFDRTREFLEIELNCSKVSVVAAKTAGQ